MIPTWRVFADSFALAAGVTLGLFAPIVGLYAVVWAVDRIEERRREEVGATQA